MGWRPANGYAHAIAQNVKDLWDHASERFAAEENGSREAKKQTQTSASAA
jgi:hypothetical protein